MFCSCRHLQKEVPVPGDGVGSKVQGSPPPALQMDTHSHRAPGTPAVGLQSVGRDGQSAPFRDTLLAARGLSGNRVWPKSGRLPIRRLCRLLSVPTDELPCATWGVCWPKSVQVQFLFRGELRHPTEAAEPGGEVKPALHAPLGRPALTLACTMPGRTRVGLAPWLFLATGALAALTATGAQVEMALSRSCPWDCLVFVQMWPGSFCVALGKRFECVMSKQADNWTIHGLWPSDVAKCCPCWHLFPSDLADLTPELDRHWPTFTNLTNFQFWENEWQKHGTCAGCVETLSSPSKYFRAALDLLRKYSVDGVLHRAGVVPSCKRSYQLSSLEAVLRPVLGEQHELQCVTDTQGRQVLVQVKVSLHRDLSPGCLSAGCDGASPYRPCRPQESIFYFPPSREHPRNPCP